MKKIKIPVVQNNTPIIILVRPQMSQNVGMVARAMMNCALYDLRLVHPREDHLSDQALSASSGADLILKNAQVFDRVEDAVADLHYLLATTARPREMTKAVYNPQKACQILAQDTFNHKKCGILFGAERTGLENNELTLADAIIEIPLNPLHMSLNLSQAVLLIGYEWFKNQNKKDISHFETGGSPLATKGQVDAFLKHLEDELDKRGYFRFTEKKERMQRNLRNIFARNNLTLSEINTLHGVVNDLIRKTKEEQND